MDSFTVVLPSGRDEVSYHHKNKDDIVSVGMITVLQTFRKRTETVIILQNIQNEKMNNNLVTLFFLEQNNFFLEHKLSPVHLTWPGQVDWRKLVFQEKIILFQRK